MSNKNNQSGQKPNNQSSTPVQPDAAEKTSKKVETPNTDATETAGTTAETTTETTTETETSKELEPESEVEPELSGDVEMEKSTPYPGKVLVRSMILRQGSGDDVEDIEVGEGEEVPHGYSVPEHFLKDAE